jgi:hypothetical protein
MVPKRAHVAAVAFGFAVVTAVSGARAACPTSARGTQSDLGARLSGQWLYEAELRDARRARVWRYAWSGVNGGLAVGAFGLMPFASRDQRIELAVGGVYSTAAAVFTWFVPLEVESTLDRRGSPVALCQGLHLEETFAAAAAADEADRVTWPWHALNFGAGALYTTIVVLGTGQWVNGIVDGVLTVVLGEAQLITQPTRLANQWETYDQAGAGPRHAFWVSPDRDRSAFVFSFTTTF